MNNDLAATPSPTFDELILADLIDEGYTSEELAKEFKARNAQIRPAVKKMIEAARAAARGEGEFYSYEDVFADNEEE